MAEHPVTQYALDVCYSDYGKLCGELEIAACRRHLEDLKKSKSPGFPYVFDESRADRILKHFQLLPRPDVANTNIILEPWQIFDYGCPFGWVEKETGRRRFNLIYYRNSRGHAKTVGAAGIGLFIMCGDVMYPPDHPEDVVYDLDPEIDIIAVDAAQGRRAREDMANMAQNCAPLSKRLDIKKTYLRHKTRGGSVFVLSRDKNNKSGGRPSLLITEEYHEHPDSTRHEIARKGLGKRSQSLEVIITTAGKDAVNSPCYQDDLQYKRVLRGEVVQDRVFVMMREIDDADDPHDRSCWGKAMPFIRHGSDYAKTLLETVITEYEDAYAANNLDKIRSWLIQRMNRWQADSENKYFSGCREIFETLALPREDFRTLTRNVPGHYGFDLGKTRDLSGSAYVGLLPDGRVAVSVMGFMPQNSAAAHAHGDRVPYLEWAKEGYVTLTPGDVTDNNYVEQWIYDSEEKYGWSAAEIDYDGHNAVDMAIRMRDYYNDEDKVVEIPQTCAALNQATKRFRELVLQKRIVWEYNPLFLWCLDNAVEVINNFGDIKLSKRHKDDTQRIDPLAAAINALARLIVKIDNHIDVNKVVSERESIF